MSNNLLQFPRVPESLDSIIKPEELVDIVEMTPLTLQDRRIYNLLIGNAWNSIFDRQTARNRAQRAHAACRQQQSGRHRLAQTADGGDRRRQSPQQRQRPPFDAPDAIAREPTISRRAGRSPTVSRRSW